MVSSLDADHGNPRHPPASKWKILQSSNYLAWRSVLWYRCGNTHLDKGSQEQYQLVKFQITAIRLLHSIRPWLVNRKVESASTVLFNQGETENRFKIGVVARCRYMVERPQPLPFQ